MRIKKKYYACLHLIAALILGCLIAGVVYASETEDNIRAIQKEAIAKELGGDIDGAIDTYETAATIASEEYGQKSALVGDLYFDMGVLALDSAKFDRAEHYLSRAATLKENSVNAHLKLAELLSLRGTNEKNEQALRQIQIALAKDPRSPAARQALANFYSQQHQAMKALKQYFYLDQALRGKAVPREKVIQSQAPPKSVNNTALPQPAVRKPQGLFKLVKPHPIAKPKPAKPKLIPKPAPPPPKPHPQVVKPRPVLKRLKATPEKTPARPKHGRNGLVPPPPPVMPMFGGAPPAPAPMPSAGNPGFHLKTEAKLKTDESKAKTEEKATKPASEEKATHAQPQENPDFLLDWASERKKK